MQNLNLSWIQDQHQTETETPDTAPTIWLHDREFVPFIAPEEIRWAVVRMAREINTIYGNTPITVLPVLKGAFIFAADLVRHLTMPVEIQFLRISTYGNSTKSSGTARDLGPLPNIRPDSHILMLEDIVDSGFTADQLHDHIQELKPASLRLATLLYKPDSFSGKWTPDFCGIRVPSRFVVGYGLDYAEHGRELPGLWQEKSSMNL